MPTHVRLHSTSHQNGGDDEIATATPAANAIPKATSSGDLDPGWLPGGRRDYGALASDPSSPTPTEGDVYYNTALEMEMRYDGSRSKWLSVESSTFLFGRNGDTPGGAFYRGINGLSFSTSRGYTMPHNGTVTELGYSRDDSDSATFAIRDNTAASIITTVASSATTGVDTALDDDFSSQNVLAPGNNTGSNATSNVHGWFKVKWRA